MTTEETLRATLQEAEKRVLEALADAARNGDLAGVDAARTVVAGLRGITLGFDRPSPIRSDAVHARRPVEETVGGKKRKAQRYPRFEIRNETLYRIAFSRKTNAEYEHKVPKKHVDQICRALAVASVRDEPIEVGEIVGRVNRSSAVQIPQYQVYSVIGWLRATKQIDQVGRDGYRIPSSIQELAEQQWRELKSKSKR
jgi:hypothetical protein